MAGSSPSIDEVWSRLANLQGKAFETKTGKPFTYTIAGEVLHTSRTKYNIPKTEVAKALEHVPLEGPGVISNTVRGSAYVWAVLHDKRIRRQDW